MRDLELNKLYELTRTGSMPELDTGTPQSNLGTNTLSGLGSNTFRDLK